MVKIPLTKAQHNKLVQYGKTLFESGKDPSEVYPALVGYCRDNFGFWMLEEQATDVYMWSVAAAGINTGSI